MDQTLGIAQFWAQGDAVTHAVAVLLLLMSTASWYVIAGKVLAHWRLRRAVAGLQSFWEAGSPDAALQSMAAQDATGIFAGVAGEALAAARSWQSRSASGIGAGVDAGEYVGRTLQQAIAVAQARVEGGLTLLASVGSTAPFVGLFGTVWGIYHALVGLSGASQVVLDKVAGPVGEALIMTAAGLFVAIPAVLAYNTFTRTNRLVLARLDGFANSLHAWLVGGLKPEAGGTGRVMS